MQPLSSAVEPTPSHSTFVFAGLTLCSSAVCFWTAWALMPGVGVTDAATILTLVGAHPTRVVVSAALQLASAALLALAIPGLSSRFAPSKWGRAAAALLAVGACGDAADAIYHQLAYEMTRPGVDQAAMLPVMQRMQSVDLLFLAPLILAFFLGCISLAIAGKRLGIVSGWNPALYSLCLPVMSLDFPFGLSPRMRGLAFLGFLSLSLMWIGAAVCITRSEDARAHAQS